VAAKKKSAKKAAKEPKKAPTQPKKAPTQPKKAPKEPKKAPKESEIALRARVRALEMQLAAERRARQLVEERAAAIENEAKRYYDQYVHGEIHNANVANLFVASARINETLRRDEVHEAIKEIVINLIGSEELVIYERVGDVLRVAASFGMSGEQLAEVPIGRGLIGRAAASGTTWVVGNGDARGAVPGERHLTACIPLRVGGEVIGAIAIFRLLGHKRGLEDVDRELFALLGTQAAAALQLAARVD
jgi:putative methionine-R-sulfoxide reductase with GAF domain